MSLKYLVRVATGFEPIRIIVWLPEPDCFFRYRIGYGTLQPCLGCQRAVLLHTYMYWCRAARASHGIKMVLFIELSEDNCGR